MSGTWASGWVTGDIVTAAEFQKGAGLVADSTAGGAVASIDLSSLPTSYAHMRVYLYLRGDTAAATTTVLIRFNADSGTNYDVQRISTAATTTTGTEQFGQTSCTIGNIPANSAGANLFAAYTIDIPHYGGSSNNKDFTAVGAVKTGTSTGNLEVRTTAGFWRSNSAINRVQVFPGAGNFVADSRMSIYCFGD